tara:strand:+ start:33758 stop:35080 length:1323 start_codon:yes stop_codon:yes gene_type:complete
MNFNIKNGLNLWNEALDVIPGGNMLLSKNKNLYSPSLWPCYYSKVKGSNVWDIDGNKYLDFSSNGVGACSLGHANKNVDSEVIKTIKNGVMSSLNTPLEVSLSKTLISLHSWSNMCRLARTGGEANSIAIRIARAYSGKDKIAICGYHGWHDWYLAANLKGKDTLKDHLLEGLGSKGVPNLLSGSIIPLRFNNFEDLDLLSNNNEIAALKMEVTRTVPPKENYLEKIRKICDKKNIILIFDECTTGFRESYGGIHLNYGINPDMCMFGKALGNGYAISAIIGKREIMMAACETFISSTFWTEAVGPAAGTAALKQMKKLKSWEKLPKIGKQVKEIWSRSASKHNLQIQINGIDALPTFQFICDKPEGFKTALTELMLEKGFLATTLFYPTVAHSKQNLNDYKEALDDTFKQISRELNSSNGDPSNLCKNGFCKPTFKRLN